MPKIWFDEEIAATYDEDSADRFEPGLLAATTDFLAGLAGDGRALELAIGTGRVAVPLAERGGAGVGHRALAGTCSSGCGPSRARRRSRPSRAT